MTERRKRKVRLRLPETPEEKARKIAKRIAAIEAKDKTPEPSLGSLLFVDKHGTPSDMPSIGPLSGWPLLDLEFETSEDRSSGELRLQLTVRVAEDVLDHMYYFARTPGVSGRLQERRFITTAKGAVFFLHSVSRVITGGGIYSVGVSGYTDADAYSSVHEDFELVFLSHECIDLREFRFERR